IKRNTTATKVARAATLAALKCLSFPHPANSYERSLTAMSNGLREWSQHPDGFFAQAWCEVVGQKG
ncbi:MAG: hypothetical protein V7L11_07055, partial [Nostoc sp.]|uniref:hypothetical protein n=1 Tax=Nostoc sp. TaxID=1180 RepID=UPI002FF7333D